MENIVDNIMCGFPSHNALTEFTNDVKNLFSKHLKKVFDEFEVKEDDFDDDDIKSYLKQTKLRYEDGELVEKVDKEYVDGECTKFEEYSKDCDTKCLSNIKHNKESKKECKCKKEIAALKKENEMLKKQIDEMAKYMDNLNDKIRTLKNENDKLNSIFDKVRNCF